MPTEPDIIVRDATVEDIPSLVEARRRMFEAMGCEDRVRLDVADTEFSEFLGRELPAGRACGWIAEETAIGEWVGAVTNIWVDWPSSPYIAGEGRAYLFGLFVRPEYRRQGVARALVREATDAARERGSGAVMLHASDQGRPLYESLGFESTTEMRLILARNGERHG